MLIARLADGHDDHVSILGGLGNGDHIVGNVGHGVAVAGVRRNSRGDGQTLLLGAPAAHKASHVVRAGTAHQNVLPRILRERQRAVVLEQGHRLFGSLKVHRGVFLVAHEGHSVVHIAVGILKYAQLELRLYNARGSCGEDVLVDLALSGQLLHLVDQADGFAADAVHTALRHADDDSLLVGNLLAGHGAQALLNGPDHAPVGLDDAFKTHLLAEQILKRSLGANRTVFHIQRQRHGIIGHNGAHIHLNGGVVGLQVNLQGFLVRNDGRSVLAVHLRTCAREVLDARHDAVGIETILAVLERHNLRPHHLRHQIGILAEGLHDAAPARLGGDVALRGEGHAHADSDVLVSGNFRQPGHQLLIAGCCQSEVVSGDRCTGDVGQTMHGVHRHQHRHAQPGGLGVFLHGVHGFSGGLHAVQLANEQHADAVVGAIFLQIRGNLSVGAGQIGGVLHLRDLLAHGHLGDQVGGAGIRVKPPVLIDVQRAVAIEVDELIAICLDNGFHAGVECRLVVNRRLFGNGASGHHAPRHDHRGQQGQTTPEKLLSQQGSILLSRWIPS